MGVRALHLRELERRERAAARALDHVIEPRIRLTVVPVALGLLLEQDLLEVAASERLLVASSDNSGLLVFDVSSSDDGGNNDPVLEESILLPPGLLDGASGVLLDADHARAVVTGRTSSSVAVVALEAAPTPAPSDSRLDDTVEVCS